MSSRDRRRLVILLHGVGGRGADIAALGTLWTDALPGVDFAAPDAPHPFDQGGPGRQWFSISGVTEANRPGRVQEARAAFDAVLSDLVAAHGLSDDLDRVALVGFSQGAIMALDAVASGRWPVAAVVAFAGRLATPGPLRPAVATPVLLSHGLADPVIPAGETERAAGLLREAGMGAQTDLVPGLGHSIDRLAALRAAGFLAQGFGAARA